MRRATAAATAPAEQRLRCLSHGANAYAHSDTHSDTYTYSYTDAYTDACAYADTDARA